MSELCKCLHEQLEQLPLISHPVNPQELPENGIYFFYEEGETWGHGGDGPRIVRVGSHSGRGNLRSRISETYLLDERRLNFGPDKAKPADRSIFRKNVSRALLNRDGDDYLQVWDIDFTLKSNRDRFRDRRRMEKERRLEESISALLRNRFHFRVIEVGSAAERKQLEKRLIGTLARCEVCSPSESWLGRSSPKAKIRDGKLWQVRHLKADPLGAREKEAVLRAISVTMT